MLGVVGVEPPIASREPYPLSVGPIDAEHVATHWGSGPSDLGDRMPVDAEALAAGVIDGKVEGAVGRPVLHHFARHPKHTVGRRVGEFDAAVAADDRDPVVEGGGLLCGCPYFDTADSGPLLDPEPTHTIVGGNGKTSPAGAGSNCRIGGYHRG
jgi:hypothetical protein